MSPGKGKNAPTDPTLDDSYMHTKRRNESLWNDLKISESARKTQESML